MTWRNLFLLVLFADVGKVWHMVRHKFRLDRYQRTPFEWVGTEPTETEPGAFTALFADIGAFYLWEEWSFSMRRDLL